MLLSLYYGCGDYSQIRGELTATSRPQQMRQIGKVEVESEGSRLKSPRWVVERTHGWMNRFRRILVRWDKSPDNYIAFLHFACAFIAFRAAGLLG